VIGLKETEDSDQNSSKIAFMWTCPKCGRIFGKAKQPHSCRQVSLEQHFINKNLAKELFEHLVNQIESKIGLCKIISIPCCIHLFGHYDFLAALPKKDGLEIRFACNQCLASPRIKVCVPLSNKLFKNCLDINTVDKIDEELLDWLRKAYSLKEKH
jgi:hypothetical protein